MKTILLIDDTQEQLEGLEAALRREVAATEANVLTWQPKRAEGEDAVEPVEQLENLLNRNDVAFVVTDYDLTGKGGLGFYGSTVVDHCQLRAVPVGDYSRGNKKRLPSEPTLFEIRVPTESHGTAAKYIAAVFRGFEEIRQKVEQISDMPRSPSAGIAALLDRPNDQSQFSLYGVRYPSVNSGLLDRLDNAGDAGAAVRRLFSYVAGHVLLNLVLRYPGPIVSLKALAAYCAVNVSEADRLRATFADCRYEGPFRECDEHFWLDQVDRLLDEVELDAPPAKATSGELHRLALEKRLSVELVRPECPRCQGQNGGFLCPFTSRTVCLRPDCSSGANGWIPAGARLSRIEKDFFDEWGPLLGM
jgi:hypothetical protein